MYLKLIKSGESSNLNDFDEYLDWKPKLVEIHLVRDLTNTDLNEFVKKYDSIESELVVHAPEYFEDKLIDFATDQISVLDTLSKCSRELLNFLVN